MTKTSTLQIIHKYLDQPLPLELRKMKNQPMVYPNRSMKRHYYKPVKPSLFNSFGSPAKASWCSVVQENINHGNLLHNSYLEELAYDEQIADRELYQRKLEHFVSIYGETKGNEVMRDYRNRLLRMNTKIDL